MWRVRQGPVAVAALSVLVAATLAAWLMPAKHRPAVTSLAPVASAPSDAASPEPAGPRPTATVSPEPTPTPASSPGPDESPSERTTDAAPSATPSLHGDPPCAFYGEPCGNENGWTTGYAACHNATASDVPSDKATAAVFHGVVATLSMTGPQVATGGTLLGELRLHNTGQEEVSLTISRTYPEDEVALLSEEGGNAVHTSDLVAGQEIDLEPGESWAMPQSVTARRCGTSPEAKEPALAPGSYTAGWNYSFMQAKVAGSVLPESEPTYGEFAVGVPVKVT